MAANPHIQEKIYRLETLKKTQAYYGPHTPYQIVVEINQLEAELRRMLRADLTRPAKPSRHKAGQAAKSAKATQPAKTAQPVKKVTKSAVKKPPQKKPFWYLSKSTRELIGIMAFIGLVFLFSSIIFAAYAQSRKNRGNAWDGVNPAVALEPTLRPTFTPTLEPGGVAPAEAAIVQSAGDTLTAPSGEVNLPSAEKVATPIPTLVPTLTPSVAPSPTPVPPPTETPVPPPPPPPPPRPAPAQPQPAAAVPAAAPANPTSAPAPSPSSAFPFVFSEQGNREFQKTNYHGITIYVAIVSEGNIPMGGMKVVGDHSSGLHAESALSDWFWSVTNCLDCDYVKFGNVKFEPGTFSDGVWSIYVADAQGNQLSEAVGLPYSSDPNQWVWDFVIFKKVGG